MSSATALKKNGGEILKDTERAVYNLRQYATAIAFPDPQFVDYVTNQVVGWVEGNWLTDIVEDMRNVFSSVCSGVHPSCES